MRTAEPDICLDAVDLWHDLGSPSPIALADWLGLSPRDYHYWVMDPANVRLNLNHLHALVQGARDRRLRKPPRQVENSSYMMGWATIATTL